MNRTAIETLAFIISYKSANDGISPTMNSIAETLGTYKMAVVRAIRDLEEEKLIKVIRDENDRMVGIAITGGRWSCSNSKIDYILLQNKDDLKRIVTDLLV